MIKVVFEPFVAEALVNCPKKWDFLGGIGMVLKKWYATNELNCHSAFGSFVSLDKFNIIFNLRRQASRMVNAK